MKRGNYTPEEKATYPKIKEYVKNKYGVNVHTSYIAQVKRMCGLDMGENYNKSKKENPEVKQCLQEKLEYIKDAFNNIDKSPNGRNEFFTPDGPSRLCATLASLGLDEAKTVGDCTCGSASMLLEVQKHLTTHKVDHFYGQEQNTTTYNLSRMNMIMHGVDWQNFDIYKGDTLKDDKYGDDLKLTVQVCNPPYSLKWSADKKFEDDPRYSGAGKLAPKGQADLAFVEHMIYHMDDSDGRVAVLLPHGVLFRGGAEEAIRKYIIKDLNRLDAVIGLPANLFHGTGIPVCVLVLKSKRNGNSENILFIDASKEFKAGKNQNVLEQEHIDNIVDAYAKRENVDKFAHVADMSEIIENGYNLNIPRYVDTFEEEEPVDLNAVKAQIKTLDSETKAAIDKAESFMRQLGL